MREQFNFALSAEDAAPILKEARRRGMVEKDGSPNRAMIARTLVQERMRELAPTDDDAELIAFAKRLKGGKRRAKRVLAREHLNDLRRIA